MPYKEVSVPCHLLLYFCFEMNPSGAAGVQQGIEDGRIDYYDIMVIGRTGLGKSTTADKLLIANLTNIDYRGAGYEDPQVDGQRMVASDLTIWLISDEFKKAEKRLKDLIMCRGLEDPRKEVNFTHSQQSPVTRNCELISNETTKVRVLDVPGFFGVDAGDGNGASPTDTSLPPALARAQNIAHSDLGIMRKILHIQSAMGMKFKRILYFLPEKGPLRRDSGNLQMELGSMVHHFGKSIFECMVLIATLPETIYKHVNPNADLFSEEDMTTTQQVFQLALRRVLPGTEPLPKPPIVFLSMFDSCELVFNKIHRAPVAKNVVRLVFDSETCARCGIKTKMLGQEKVACFFGSNPSDTIPYEESTCHPLLIPKYSRVVKVLGGIAHLLTFRVFMGKWPSFKNMDEVCIDCRRAPGSTGCFQVGRSYVHEREELIIQHTSNEDEPIVVVVEETEGREPNEEDYLIPRNRPQGEAQRAEQHIVVFEPPQIQLHVEGAHRVHIPNQDVEGACDIDIPDRKG